MADWNTEIIEEFRANQGKVGGQFGGAPLLLLHHIGAKSGTEHVSPVMYLADGPRYIVFASKGGADTNPAWYHNLLANPDLRVEVGEDTVAVHATEVRGAERDALYATQAQRYPGFADYQKKTTRVIPVVALTPAGS